MDKRSYKVNKWIWLVALIFFCKALVLAFWITPLWEVPDETGHFAYARDVACGKGLPILGKAVIGADILRHVHGKEVEETKMNWIAQHPPLYYIGAGAFWNLATYLTHDPEWLFKAPRVMSAISGALTLVVLYYMLVFVSGDRLAGLGFASCVGFIPMFSHLSSGTSNDTTVTLFAALAIYFWVRFLLKKKTSDAYCMAVWLSLACATKMTALLLLPPMLAIVMIELALPWALRIRHILAISATSLLLPVLWMLRMFLLFDYPFAAAGSLNQASNRLNASFIDYISKTDALESIFVHFWGMFGFAGKFRDVTLLRIEGWPLNFFSYVSLIAVMMLASIMVCRFFVFAKRTNHSVSSSGSASIMDSWHNMINGSKAAGVLSFVLLGVAALFGVFAHQLIFSSAGGEVRVLFFTGSAFVMCMALVVFTRPLDPDERLVCYCLLSIAFFVAVFAWKLYGMYLFHGSARALHGRYFYPLIPLFLVATLLPVTRWLKLPSQAGVIAAVLFVIAEMVTMLQQVIPLWRNL